MLYLIGLGLGDVRDISVRGLDIVRQCDKVYLEAYTSILPHGPSKEKLEAFYGRPVELADRELVEQGADALLDAASTGDVALLVVGDPFGATTHADLALRAHRRQVPFQAVHNASILTAVGCAGLQLYRFGETVSLVLWTDHCRPTSYYEKIVENYVRGLHTLCLLDIKVKEQSVENLMKGRKVYEPARYMTASEAAEQLIEISRLRSAEGADCPVSSASLCVAVARLGWPDQQLVSCTLAELANNNDDELQLGPPLHSLIVCADKLHPCEEEAMQMWRRAGAS